MRFRHYQGMYSAFLILNSITDIQQIQISGVVGEQGHFSFWQNISISGSSHFSHFSPSSEKMPALLATSTSRHPSHQTATTTKSQKNNKLQPLKRDQQSTTYLLQHPKNCKTLPAKVFFSLNTGSFSFHILQQQPRDPRLRLL